MGTNYYVIKNKCECCKRSDREYHIGKSSYGWAFSFQGYKWNNLTSWEQWKQFLRNEIIEDEYGQQIDYEWFVQMIETYKAPKYKREDGHVNLDHYEEAKKSGWINPEYDWVDPDGYSFTSREFS